MDTIGYVGAEFADRERERAMSEWQSKARELCLRDPFKRESLIATEFAIGVKEIAQRSILEHAGSERRTLDHVEQRNYEMLRSELTELRRKLWAVLNAALPDPRQ